MKLKNYLESLQRVVDGYKDTAPSCAQSNDAKQMIVWLTELEELRKDSSKVTGVKYSSPSYIRGEYLLHIKKHEYLPEHVKDLLTPIITHHFRIMSEITAALELAVRRTEMAGSDED